MEPEFHQLGVRIQQLNICVRDAIVTIANGCCIYFGRLDEAVISDNDIDTSNGVSISSAPDLIEMAKTHSVLSM